MYIKPEVIKTLDVQKVADKNAVYSDAWGHSSNWNHSSTNTSK